MTEKALARPESTIRFMAINVSGTAKKQIPGCFVRLKPLRNQLRNY